MDTAELLKRIQRIEIKTKALTQSNFAGDYHSAFKGRGMSFAEVREYREGDDVRDIDWNVTARTSKPHVKVFEEERELCVMLLVDVSGSLKFGTRHQTMRDMAAELAATLAFSALDAGDKTGVIFFSDRIEAYLPPRKGKQHILGIVRTLLSLQPQGRRTDVGKALEFLMRVQRRRAVVFLMSDFCAVPPFDTPLRIAAHRHDVMAIRLCDPLMEQLPRAGLWRVEDAETGHEEYVNTSSKRVRQAYAAWMAQESERLATTFKSAGCAAQRIRTDGDHIKPLKALFAMKGRLRG